MIVPFFLFHCTDHVNVLICAPTFRELTWREDEASATIWWIDERKFIAADRKKDFWDITEIGDLDLSDWKLDSTTCRNLSCLSLQNLIWQFCQSQAGTWALGHLRWLCESLGIPRNSLLKPFESQRNHLVKEQGSNCSQMLVKGQRRRRFYQWYLYETLGISINSLLKPYVPLEDHLAKKEQGSNWGHLLDVGGQRRRSYNSPDSTLLTNIPRETKTLVKRRKAFIFSLSLFQFLLPLFLLICLWPTSPERRRPATKGEQSLSPKPLWVRILAQSSSLRIYTLRLQPFSIRYIQFFAGLIQCFCYFSQNDNHNTGKVVMKYEL